MYGPASILILRSPGNCRLKARKKELKQPITKINKMVSPLLKSTTEPKLTVLLPHLKQTVHHMLTMDKQTSLVS
jgi:hypothetical protein